MPVNKYSIILPVRNGGEYVKECVHSILAQTYPHFNLVVLDNCSTDGTLQWISALNDKRIIVYPSKDALPIDQNWGRIISVPKNEFMTCIGHDDILMPTYLERIEALIQQYPDASLYQTHFNFIDANGKHLRNCMPMEAVQHAPAFLEKILTMTIDVNGTGFMVRSKDYAAVGGIPPFPNLIFADFALWLDITRRSFKVTAVENAFSYRLHQSVTTTTPPETFYAAFNVFIQYLQSLKKQDPALETVIDNYAIQIISFYCRSFAHKLLRTPVAKRNGLTVAGWITKCSEWAEMLVGNTEFNPSMVPGVRPAAFIDSNIITRQLFLWFKKIYTKPVWQDR